MKQNKKQEKHYNLKNDIIFKAFFSRKGNEEFLIDFLNALLNIEIVKIEIKEEVNLEQLSTEEKGGRLDLQATLNDGVIVNIEWYFIELPKFRKSHPNMNEKINQWLAFLDDYRKEWVEMAESKNKVIERAKVEMNYLTGDEEVRRLAELREKWEADYKSSINYAERKGVKKGIKETARRMLDKKMDIQDIIEVTGLTEEEIEEIKNNNNILNNK